MQPGNIVYFLVWAAVIFFMMRYGCGAHMMGHGHPPGPATPPDEHSRDTPEWTVDPVCGKTVATATAKSAIYRGRAFYFCSPDCRAGFEANPDAYAGAGAGAPASHEGHHHGC